MYIPELFFFIVGSLIFIKIVTFLTVDLSSVANCSILNIFPRDNVALSFAFKQKR